MVLLANETKFAYDLLFSVKIDYLFYSYYYYIKPVPEERPSTSSIKYCRLAHLL